MIHLRKTVAAMLALGLSALAPSTHAVPIQATVPLLAEEQLPGDDWGPVLDWIEAYVPSEQLAELATINTKMAVWVDAESLSRVGTNVKAWVHIEIFSAESARQAGLRSMMLLFEFRCESGQRRQLAGATYSGTNLSGSSEAFDESQPSAWTYIRPDQIDREMMQAACDGIRISDEFAQ